MTIHYQAGKRRCRTAFLLSCPGRKEQGARQPVAGTTGTNLDKALFYLHQKLPRHFAFKRRSDYRITNAWSRVEFRGRTGRSEPTKKEIRGHSNLARLKRELRGMRLIVCCGKRACYAAGAIAGLDSSTMLVQMRHLSLQSMNRWRREERDFRNLDEKLRGWSQIVVQQVRGRAAVAS